MTGCRRWLLDRRFPLLATAGLIVIGMAATTWGDHWVAAVVGSDPWAFPGDLWSTLVAAHRLLHLQWSGLYTPPTGLISFPGAALILVPAAALLDAAGLGLSPPGAGNLHPGAWLIAGPCAMALAGTALFAADAAARRLGASQPKRALLAAAGAVAVGNVSLGWGHPEDAVAVALLLYAILALCRGQASRSAWLTGAAVAVQPLVLLALPFVLVLMPPRRLAGYLARAAAPAVVLLGAAAAANPAAVLHAVTSQPNWPAIDHPTPWTSLAPQLAAGAVAAGPGRILAIILACGCALLTWRRWRGLREAAAPGQAGPGQAGSPALGSLLWWVALALALRCVVEPVMVAYYAWPALAVALIAAASAWRRLIATSAAAVAVIGVSQASWQGPWLWWGAMTAGLCLTLAAARLPAARPAQPRPAAAPGAGAGAAQDATTGGGTGTRWGDLTLPGGRPPA
jgi:hypothetical protein